MGPFMSGHMTYRNDSNAANGLSSIRPLSQCIQGPTLGAPAWEFQLDISEKGIVNIRKVACSLEGNDIEIKDLFCFDSSQLGDPLL